MFLGGKSITNTTVWEPFLSIYWNTTAMVDSMASMIGKHMIPLRNQFWGRPLAWERMLFKLNWMHVYKILKGYWILF